MKKLLAFAFSLIATAATAQWNVPPYNVPLGLNTPGNGFRAAPPPAGGSVLLGAGASTYPAFSTSLKIAGPIPYIDVTAAPYNAKIDGVTDDTTAFLSAIAAATGKSQTVYVPCINNNVSVISETLVLGRGVHLATCQGGSGQGSATPTGVTLKWTGSANQPMVKFFGAIHSSLVGFQLNCNSLVNGSNGCIGIQYASDNNPSTSYNEITDVTVLNAHMGLVVGDPSTTVPPLTGGVPICAVFSNLNCAQADSLTVKRFNVKGNGLDVTSEAVHVNDANGIQSSHFYQGNWQFVSIGLNVIFNNGNWVLESFNGGNPIGEKTFVKFSQYALIPPALLNNETEGGYTYAVRDLSDTGEGSLPLYRYSTVAQYNQWNNPVSCEGNGRWLSIGNVGGGAGNAWTAGGNCYVVSQLEPTNQGTTSSTPWTTSGSGQVTTWGVINGQTILTANNIVSGAIPTNMPLGFGNLAASSATDVGRITLGSDGLSYLQRSGIAWNLSGAALGASAGVLTAPAAASPGDLFATRTATSGALLLGSDGNKYILRNGNNLFLTGATVKINTNQIAAPTPVTNSALQILGANTADVRSEVAAFAGSAFQAVSRSNGTAGTPTAISSTNSIGGYEAWGYTGSALQLGAAVNFTATENWNAGANGTSIGLATVTTGSTTLATRLTLSSAGIFTNGAAGGAQGDGTINATNLLINGVSVGNAVSMTANTVLGNATGSTAAPTNLAMPSCSTASSGLIWTTNTGFGCSTTLARTSTTQVFTSNGTYTPTSGMKMAFACAFGAGGGGGGGARQAAANAVSGGGGGGGGGTACGWFTAAMIGASQPITIGTAGTAGAAAAADNTAGGNGGGGGQTVFGTLNTGPSVRAAGGGGGAGGQLASTSGGGGGGGATAGGNATGASGGAGGILASAGGTGTSGTANNNPMGGSGGGGGGATGTPGNGGISFSGGSGGGAGGGITAANAAQNGGVSVAVYGYGAGNTSTGTGGVVGGAAAGNGLAMNVTGPFGYAGTGGGGGAAALTGTAGTGGIGGFPGGGGGGGGSNQNTFTAGVGGVGGAGYVTVVEYF